ncbi:hypothetical protein [Halomonas sp. BMC6]|uniref:hypothetical protein n=1 Tax=Halomonas sp. BMC6 TaxID=3073244 RepID=UPI0030CBF6DF
MAEYKLDVIECGAYGKLRYAIIGESYWFWSTDVCRIMNIGKKCDGYYLSAFKSRLPKKTIALTTSLLPMSGVKRSYLITIKGIDALERAVRRSVYLREYRSFKPVFEEHVKPIISSSEGCKLSGKKTVLSDEDRALAEALGVVSKTIKSLREENRALKEKMPEREERYTVSKWLAINDIFVTDPIKNRIAALSKKISLSKGETIDKKVVNFHREAGVIKSKINVFTPEILNEAIEHTFSHYR